LTQAARYLRQGMA